MRNWLLRHLFGLRTNIMIRIWDGSYYYSDYYGDLYKIQATGQVGNPIVVSCIYKR